MFQIISENFDGIEKIRISNLSNGEYLSIIPEYGGNINELSLKKNNEYHSLIAGDKNLATLSGKMINQYRGAKLSPFPNRIQHGKYRFNNQNYELSRNENNINSLHGFMWNKPFLRIGEQLNESYARLILASRYEGENPGFPFHYDIKVDYIFKEGSFVCTTHVLNMSEHPMPIADGWHPYFKTGNKVDRLKLQLPVTSYYKTDDILIPTMEKSEMAEYKGGNFIGENHFDHCFGNIPYAMVAETSITDEEKNITIVVWQQSGEDEYNYINVYTPEDRESIAIEPMTCAPNAFNNKEGLIILAAGEQRSFQFGVKLI